MQVVRANFGFQPRQLCWWSTCIQRKRTSRDTVVSGNTIPVMTREKNAARRRALPRPRRLVSVRRYDDQPGVATTRPFVVDFAYGFRE